MKQKNYIAGLYFRLSQEDERQGESVSIENQRTMLRKYAEEHGFEIHGEYIDDGISGTTFDRPEVQRLLDDAKTGVINTIIVKDLSRFGRNYIEVGQYVDYVFEASEYAVTVGEIVNGQISISPEGNSLAVGTEITVTATPAEGYELKEICVNGKAIEGNIFVLAQDSVITAVFEKIQYAVTVGELVNGQISISPEGNSLAVGTEITVTATPAEGYELKEICVNGKAIEGNTFILTQDSVITAVFEEMEVHPPRRRRTG